MTVLAIMAQRRPQVGAVLSQEERWRRGKEEYRERPRPGEKQTARDIQKQHKQAKNTAI